MSQILKTQRCIRCGENATIWHGHVIAKERMALGNLIDKRVIAGFCEKHKEYDTVNNDGYYGEYDSELMGKCVPLFNNKTMDLFEEE